MRRTEEVVSYGALRLVFQSGMLWSVVCILSGGGWETD